MTRVSGGDWRVCIVAAGPGTGKTTFAAQRLAGTDGAWLSLDDTADHPETFWLSVATALQYRAARRVRCDRTTRDSEPDGFCVVRDAVPR